MRGVSLPPRPAGRAHRTRSVLAGPRWPARIHPERTAARLQVRGDDVNVTVPCSHSHPQTTTTHLVHQPRTVGSGRIVADLDRQESGRERPDVDVAVEGSPADEGDPDPTLVRYPQLPIGHRHRESLLQPLQRHFTADLLQRQDVRPLRRSPL